jgi:hypothetical protein
MGAMLEPGNSIRLGALGAQRKIYMGQKRNIQFDLLSNARDSFRQAVELLAWRHVGSDQTQLKEAITHSAHCIELLLKEKLRQIDPASVWQKPGATTVRPGMAIDLLKKSGVVFSANDEKNLKSVRDTRNEIEHYEWYATESDARVMIANVLSFAVSFAREQLKIDLASEFKKDDTWQSLIDELHEFVRAHGERLDAKARDSGGSAIECDKCGYLTVPHSGGTCEVCGHWQSIDNDD